MVVTVGMAGTTATNEAWVVRSDLTNAPVIASSTVGD